MKIAQNETKEDKIETLKNKITSLEKDLFSEKIKTTNLEEENNLLKTVKIPSFQNELNEKDSYIDSLLIEQIKLQKEINYLKDNFKSSEENKIQLTKYLIPEYQDDKDKLIINQTNKIDFLNFIYKETKSTLRKKQDEYTQQINDLNTKIKSQDEEIISLKKINSKNEKKIEELNEELNELAEINKNLTLEIGTLNEIIGEINQEKENYIILNAYHKKENEFLNKNNLSIINRIKKQDEDYKQLNDLIEEYKEKLTEVNIKTYIFKVISIGKLVESEAELVFTNEGKNNYILNIKYITSSYKYNILDINEMKQLEGQENILIIKFNKEKQRNDELFKSKEINKILKIYQEFKNKGIQFSDTKRIKKEQRRKEKELRKDLNNMFNIW
jgi:chromosome segregation ATPase